MQDTAKPATRVLIVDDHPVVLSGCRTLFASDHSIRIDEATDAKSGHRAYISKRPDVTVIDISLPDVSGFELMRRIRKDDPDAKIIMFSMNDDPAFVVRAVELGARDMSPRATIPDSAQGGAQGGRRRQFHLAATRGGGHVLRCGDQGQSGLADDPRELEILRLLGRGDKIVEVAEALGISYKTVANTTSLLKQKLGAKNHSDLIRIAVEIGMS